MRFRKSRHQGDPELDIIPFLNVMVVLIAFLLVNAVFAAVAVLDVNLPAQAQASQTQKEEEKKPKLVLDVMVYDDFLLVEDRNAGPLKKLPNVDGHADVKGLHQFLLKVKKQFPDATRVSLLCENDTSYQLLISVMDAVRYRLEKVAGHEVHRPLFPDISIGTAPTRAGKGGSA